MSRMKNTGVIEPHLMELNSKQGRGRVEVVMEAVRCVLQLKKKALIGH